MGQSSKSEPCFYIKHEVTSYWLKYWATGIWKVMCLNSRTTKLLLLNPWAKVLTLNCSVQYTTKSIITHYSQSPNLKKEVTWQVEPFTLPVYRAPYLMWAAPWGHRFQEGREPALWIAPRLKNCIHATSNGPKSKYTNLKKFSFQCLLKRNLIRRYQGLMLWCPAFPR